MKKAGSGKKLVSGGGAAAVACLVLPLVVLAVLKSDFMPQQVVHIAESSIGEAGVEGAIWQPRQQLVARSKASHDPASGDETPDKVVDANRDLKNGKGFLATKVGMDGSLIKSDGDVAAPRSKLSCNFSSYRTNMCAMQGDVRLHGKTATVYVVSASDDNRPENGTITIRPYPRKWETPTMQLVREVTIRWRAPPGPGAPRCTVTYDVPAVVFSTGGYGVNIFHAITDIIMPLYNTAREYDGRVRLVATNYDRKWIAKYRHALSMLSIYPVMDLDADNEVRCFPSVHVGTESHKELGIDSALSGKGYTMLGFRGLLRSAYSLKREWVTPQNENGVRPRLVMVLRRNSRALTNEAQVLAAATQVGFEVVAAGPEVVRDLDKFAQTVNSCDVLVGVHGAGLSNMVFLPRNATVVQIIPWGEMKWPAWTSYGEPVAPMGLRYVEYETTAEETTLKDVYPRNHTIFTDPVSIHKQGFNMLWETFLNGQNVTLDVHRFRGVLQHIYRSVT
uniref:Glycosyltransferase 61 catalytic domain-containing protein n=2 Tax=Triticum urartu TaxID=4572 RepID=A0A8R7UW24_TRIUA